MNIVAVIVGLVVGYLFCSFTGQVVVHRFEAGILPGIIAGLWAAWPLYHKYQVERSKLLHPQPKKYEVNYQTAFGKLRTILKEASYNYGNKWQIATAEPETNRMKADMTFTDEEEHLKLGHNLLPRSQGARVKRHIGLDVQFKLEGSTTTIQFDFTPSIEGINTAACDSIISEFQKSVESALGDGTPVGQQISTNLSPPPWWLIGVTYFSLVLLFLDVCKALS